MVISNKLGFYDKVKCIRNYIRTMRLKVLLLLSFFVLVRTYTQGQIKWPITSTELECSIYNIPLNEQQLSIDPFGESGSNYQYSQEFGFNFSMEVTQRFSPSLGFRKFQYFTDSYNINPFPNFNEGEELSSNSKNRIHGVAFHPKLRVQVLRAKKVRVIFGIGYQMIILDKISESRTSNIYEIGEIKEDLERQIGNFK